MPDKGVGSEDVFCHCARYLQGVQKFVDILTPPFLWPRLTDLDILRQVEGLRFFYVSLIGSWAG